MDLDPCWTAPLVTASLLAALLPLADALPTVRREALCRPAAAVTASLLGSPLAETSRGFRIEADPCPIVVAVECSGARYFCVLLALLAGLAIRRRRWRVLPVLVPIAYGVTLAANSARIACGWYVRRAAAEMFPPQTMPAVHVATGSLCFVAFLVLVYTAIDGRLAHDAAKSAA